MNVVKGARKDGSSKRIGSRFRGQSTHKAITVQLKRKKIEAHSDDTMRNFAKQSGEARGCMPGYHAGPRRKTCRKQTNRSLMLRQVQTVRRHRTRTHFGIVFVSAVRLATEKRNEISMNFENFSSSAKVEPDCIIY